MDEDFINFLVEYVDQKETQEYVSLLKGLKAFIAK